MLKVWEVTCDNGEIFNVFGERREILAHVNSEAYLNDYANPFVVNIRYVRTIWDNK